MKTKILPMKRFSYVVSESGEPMVVYLKTKNNLFTTSSAYNETVGYFLNIRHPLWIDAEGEKLRTIPNIPEECDGIIIDNYASIGEKAFIVRDLSSQIMPIDL